jgi:hypothetical protein
MSESRRDLFKLSVLGAVGLSSCTGFPREPDTGTPSRAAKQHTIANQGDIFAFGKLGDDASNLYWFLLQRLPVSANFAAYYSNGTFAEKPDDVTTATSSSSKWKWKLVPRNSTITITNQYGVGDDTTSIKADSNSIITQDCLTNFLSGIACAGVAQRSWSEINRV